MATSRGFRTSSSAAAGPCSVRNGSAVTATAPVRLPVLSRSHSSLLRKGTLMGTLSLTLLGFNRANPSPNILPISSITLSSIIYFLASIVFASFISRMKTLIMLSLRLAFSSVGSFSFFCSPLAFIMLSKTSKIEPPKPSQGSKSLANSTVKIWKSGGVYLKKSELFLRKIQILKIGGERGIRTPEGCDTLLALQASALGQTMLPLRCG